MRLARLEVARGPGKTEKPACEIGGRVARGPGKTVKTVNQLRGEVRGAPLGCSPQPNLICAPTVVACVLELTRLREDDLQRLRVDPRLRRKTGHQVRARQSSRHR